MKRSYSYFIYFLKLKEIFETILGPETLVKQISRHEWVNPYAAGR